VDTTGEEDNDILRKAIYKKTDIFFLCTKYSDVEGWMRELKNNVPDSVVYLISNSFETSDYSFSTYEGEVLKKIGAKEFFECKPKFYF
jgi:hypothetical protein